MFRPLSLAVGIVALGLVLGLSGQAQAATATVTWDANTEPDLAGYKVHYGTSPGTYDTTVDVGNVTSYGTPTLTDGTTYYFAVTAYDGTGNQSLPSLEVSLAIPGVNTPPQLTVPPDQTVEATGPLTDVNLGTATATDAEDGSLTPTADDTGPFAPGTHVITWSVTDSDGSTVTDTQTVTVTDTTSPVVTAPADVTVEATGLLTDVNLGSASATDLVDGSLTPTASPAGPYARGTHLITWTATDSEGNAGIATQTLTVVDTTAPSPPGGLQLTAQ
jgi:hypothetical protein